MAVGSKTIERVVYQLQMDKKEYTTKELAKLMGIGHSTAQQVVSIGMQLGSIIKNNGYPAKYSAVSTVPKFGETLIVKEPVAPLELDAVLMGHLREAIKVGSTPAGNMGGVFESYYKIITPVGKQEFVKLLINLAEVIKEVVENEREIDPSDLAL